MACFISLGQILYVVIHWNIVIERIYKKTRDRWITWVNNKVYQNLPINFMFNRVFYSVFRGIFREF